MQLAGLGERQWVCESALSSPNGVWGGAPADIEFGAFYAYSMTFGGSNFTNFHKREAPLGTRPKAGASLASPKGHALLTAKSKF